MSPVFRHGRLRLYLLKLLDEAPRHGYEVIRLLQDRFMGIYAPSPGTIYPRLARLEEDGLVTHEEVDGKKVYSITAKGRAEIRARLGDLADLEDELTESLRDVANQISVDVRETVRGIREELASAAREFRGEGKRAAKPGGAEPVSAKRGGGEPGSAEPGSAEPGSAEPGSAEPGSAEPGSAEPGSADQDGTDEARRIRDEARRSREQMRANFRSRPRRSGDWAAWSAWSDSAGSHDEPGGAGAWGGSGQATGSHPGDGQRSGSPNPFSDLERIAMQFATELRAAARQTGNLGERSLNELRDILTDTLAKVRTEVFADAAAQPDGEQEQPSGACGDDTDQA